ncbi:MAG TPA: histidine kinase dimerization/phospho-acceptor domain-containing protein [Sphingomicrobium sp.]|nr:histidine kinase dimerization/phospho-acceptor domain-containing protein [Sphingomicrobium sp.]
MRFDDRLRTVMMQPVEDAHDRTVRWRQLVDLLSRPHDGIDPALLDAALTMVRSGYRAVPKAVRAATARSIAGRAAEPRLIAIFAGDKLDVAAPLLAAAPMDDEGWAIVLKAASKEVKAFVQSLRGEALPPKEEEPSPPAEPAPPAEPEEPAPSIGDIAARIERLKSKREAEAPPEEPPVTPVPRPEPLTGANLFRWECDASGQIGWVEGAPRGALIGRSLPTEEGAPRELVRAFTDRLPFDDTPMRLPTPALEGEWRLSGIPAFSPTDGRFLGYRGIARREGVETEPPAVHIPGRPAADAEALRETIHEIKTPLNAIIGFAEIIDGQYLGPAHRNYRHRAAEIVAQARTLLAAIEDLDFAARMQMRAAAGTAVADLAELLPPLAEEIGNKALARDVRLRIVTSLGDLRCAIEPELGQRLLRRFIGAAVEAAPNGQLVEVDVKHGPKLLTVSLTRPISTRHLSEAQMLDPSFVEEGETSRLGLGFALRLVRGLARLAGGDLRFTQAEFQLSLPAARE